MNLTPTECPAEGKCLERTLFISPQHVIRCDGSENKMLREEKYLRLFSAFILFCCKSHIEFWEIVWNICLYKCSLKNAGSKIDVSLCVAFPCGTQRRCEARPGRCRHSCALVPCTVTYLWAALGALDHVWQLSVCVISVSFGLYVRIRECVCIHVMMWVCSSHSCALTTMTPVREILHGCDLWPHAFPGVPVVLQTAHNACGAVHTLT